MKTRKPPDYFKGCRGPDDVKRRYRELAKRMHPDRGGDPAQMAELNRQRDRALGGKPEPEPLPREPQPANWRTEDVAAAAKAAMATAQILSPKLARGIRRLKNNPIATAMRQKLPPELKILGEIFDNI